MLGKTDSPQTDRTDRLEKFTGDVKARERSITATVGTFDKKRLLGLVAAGTNAAPFLNGTLPPLIRKVNETGRGIDLLIGLNEDAPPPQILERLASEGAKLRHLRTAKKKSRADAAEVYIDPEMSGNPFRISNQAFGTDTTCIYVIHQTPSAYSAGKKAMLVDLYGFLLRSVESGWKTPQYMLNFDAESHFYLDDGNAHGEPDLETNGIRELFRPLEDNPELGLVCGRMRGTVFHMQPDNVSLPAFTGPVCAMYRFLNRIHGMPEVQVNAGTGYMGKTAVIIAAGSVGLAGYPSARSDDILMQLLIKESGYRNQVLMTTAVTNKVPAATNREAVRSQIARWIASGQDLRQFFRGYHRVKLPMRKRVRFLARLFRHPRAAWDFLCSLPDFVKAMQRVPTYREIPASGSSQGNA